MVLTLSGNGSFKCIFHSSQIVIKEISSSGKYLLLGFARFPITYQKQIREWSDWVRKMFDITLIRISPDDITWSRKPPNLWVWFLTCWIRSNSSIKRAQRREASLLTCKEMLNSPKRRIRSKRNFLSSRKLAKLSKNNLTRPPGTLYTMIRQKSSLALQYSKSSDDWLSKFSNWIFDL